MKMKTYQKVIIIISILAVLFLSLSIAYRSETKKTKDTIITMNERDPINVIAYPNDSVFLSLKSFTDGYFFNCNFIGYNPKVVIVQEVTGLNVSGYFVNINNSIGETNVGIRLINESVFINSSIFAKVQLKAVGSVYSITNRSFLEITRGGYKRINDCPPTPGCNRWFLDQVRGDFRIVSPGIITRLLMQMKMLK